MEQRIEENWQEIKVAYNFSVPYNLKKSGIKMHITRNWNQWWMKNFEKRSTNSIHRTILGDTDNQLIGLKNHNHGIKTSLIPHVNQLNGKGSISHDYSIKMETEITYLKQSIVDLMTKSLPSMLSFNWSVDWLQLGWVNWLIVFLTVSQHRDVFSWNREEGNNDSISW